MDQFLWEMVRPNEILHFDDFHVIEVIAFLTVKDKKYELIVQFYKNTHFYHIFEEQNTMN